MRSEPSETDDGPFFDGMVVPPALALAYVAVGIGLVYTLAADSTDLFLAVLAGTLVVVLVSLFVAFRREGVMTPENELVGGFVLLAMGLLFGLREFTELSSEAVFGVVFVVGVVVPSLLVQYTDYGNTD